jgi:microcystin-dependent protein
MAITSIRGNQITDGSVQRTDLDTTTAGQAVAAKLIQGANITLNSTGADAGTGDVTISTTILPTGSTIDFAGSTPPTGFLLCDGTAYSRTTYAALFAVIGTTWGTGDGSTTFNVPDLRSMVTVGAGQRSGLTNRVLGATGGEEAHALVIAEEAAHTHTMGSHTHTMGSHTHSIAAGQFSHGHGLSDSQHNHYMGWVPLGTGIALGASGYAYFGGGNWLSGNNNQAASGLSVSGNTLPAGGTAGPSTNTTAGPSTNTSDSTGSGTAHNTMPPFAVMNKIIKF